jgi:pilus assembly protein Flp/PilA
MKLFTFIASYFLAGPSDRDRGATAVEYALLVALVAGAVILIVTTLGSRIAGVFTDLVNKLPGGG